MALVFFTLHALAPITIECGHGGTCEEKKQEKKLAVTGGRMNLVLWQKKFAAEKNGSATEKTQPIFMCVGVFVCDQRYGIWRFDAKKCGFVFALAILFWNFGVCDLLSLQFRCYVGEFLRWLSLFVLCRSYVSDRWFPPVFFPSISVPPLVLSQMLVKTLSCGVIRLFVLKFDLQCKIRVRYRDVSMVSPARSEPVETLFDCMFGVDLLIGLFVTNA